MQVVPGNHPCPSPRKNPLLITVTFETQRRFLSATFDGKQAVGEDTLREGSVAPARTEAYLILVCLTSVPDQCVQFLPVARKNEENPRDERPILTTKNY